MLNGNALQARAAYPCSCPDLLPGLGVRCRRAHGAIPCAGECLSASAGLDADAARIRGGSYHAALRRGKGQPGEHAALDQGAA